MQRLEVSGVVRPIYGSLGVKRLKYKCSNISIEMAVSKHILQIKMEGTEHSYMQRTGAKPTLPSAVNSLRRCPVKLNIYTHKTNVICFYLNLSSVLLEAVPQSTQSKWCT